MRVAADRILKIVGFGHIAVIFRSGESIIPLKLCNVAHLPYIFYSLFSLTALLERGRGFSGGQGGIVLSLKQPKSRRFSRNVVTHTRFTALGLTVQVAVLSK